MRPREGDRQERHEGIELSVGEMGRLEVEAGCLQGGEEHLDIPATLVSQEGLSRRSVRRDDGVVMSREFYPGKPDGATVNAVTVPKQLEFAYGQVNKEG